MGLQPAHADADWDRYADSAYQYCDAVILGEFLGQSVGEAKTLIGLGASHRAHAIPDFVGSRTLGSMAAELTLCCRQRDVQSLHHIPRIRAVHHFRVSRSNGIRYRCAL